MNGSLAEHHSGQLHRQAACARAERILAEELSRRGWQQADLDQRRKNDPDKLEAATRLRRQTTLWVKGIVLRMRLRTSKGANASPHHHMQPSSPCRAGQGPLRI